MDGLFAKTNIVLLIIFAVCCNSLFLLPLILGIVGLITCKDPRAKQNALVVTIISGIIVGIGVVVGVINALSGSH
jgi:hypothetical protein